MKEHNGAELNTQTVGMPNPPSTQQFDARGEIWSANMRPLMISSARLKISVDGCVVFFFRARAGARPCGTIQCGGNKAHERSHCGEMYKLLLHQRCLLGLPAEVKRALCVTSLFAF